MITKIKCNTCGETFEHIVMDNRGKKKERCQYCTYKAYNKYQRERRIKKKLEASK